MINLRLVCHKLQLAPTASLPRLGNHAVEYAVCRRNWYHCEICSKFCTNDGGGGAVAVQVADHFGLTASENKTETSFGRHLHQPKASRSRQPVRGTCRRNRSFTLGEIITADADMSAKDQRRARAGAPWVRPLVVLHANFSPPRIEGVVAPSRGLRDIAPRMQDVVPPPQGIRPLGHPAPPVSPTLHRIPQQTIDGPPAFIPSCSWEDWV